MTLPLGFSRHSDKGKITGASSVLRLVQVAALRQASAGIEVLKAIHLPGLGVLEKHNTSSLAGIYFDLQVPLNFIVLSLLRVMTKIQIGVSAALQLERPSLLRISVLSTKVIPNWPRPQNVRAMAG